MKAISSSVPVRRALHRWPVRQFGDARALSASARLRHEFTPPLRIQPHVSHMIIYQKTRRDHHPPCHPCAGELAGASVLGFGSRPHYAGTRAMRAAQGDCRQASGVRHGCGRYRARWRDRGRCGGIEIAGFIQPEERFEHVLARAFGNARPVVVDGDRQPLLAVTRFDLNGVGIAIGIRGQVDDEAGEALGRTRTSSSPSTTVVSVLRAAPPRQTGGSSGRTG